MATKLMVTGQEQKSIYPQHIKDIMNELCDNHDDYTNKQLSELWLVLSDALEEIGQRPMAEQCRVEAEEYVNDFRWVFITGSITVHFIANDILWNDDEPITVPTERG